MRTQKTSSNRTTPPDFLTTSTSPRPQFEAVRKPPRVYQKADFILSRSKSALERANVVVTGGAIGIGRGIALACAAEGARVLIHYVNETVEARRTLKSIQSWGGSATLVQGDLSKERDRNRVFRTAQQFFDGAVHILINNAGITFNQDLCELSPEAAQRLVEVNLLAPILLSQHFGAQMRNGDGGVIVNFTSVHAAHPMYDHSVYAATKRGIEGLTFGSGVDLGHPPSPKQKRVRVFGIMPGWVLSENHFLAQPDLDPVQAAKDQPLGRIMTPAQMGQYTVRLITEFPDLHAAIVPLHAGSAAQFPGVSSSSRPSGKWGRRYLRTK